MTNIKKLNLQLFAEGAGASGEGGGEGATTGDNATAAAEQRLRELGVPEAKIRKSASKVASKMPATVAETKIAEQKTEATNVESAATEEKPTTEDTKDQTPPRMSWDEIMKDPEYNKQMQAVVQSRLRTAKTAEENLTKLATEAGYTGAIDGAFCDSYLNIFNTGVHFSFIASVVAMLTSLIISCW